MTVPALPADVTNGNAISAAHMNSLLDLVQFFRDDRPILKMRQYTTGAESPNWFPDEQITSAATVECRFSNGSGTFATTPIINVGGFTAGTAGDSGVYVPETGVYRLTAHATWSGGTSGVRQLQLTDEGSNIPGGIDQVPASASGSIRHSVAAMRFFTAGDEIGVTITQNSGGELGCTVYLDAEWLNSSAS